MAHSGNSCELVRYQVEEYGQADFVENIEVGNGEFRRARAMLPFAYLDARGTDFRWEIYGQDMQEQKNMVNAFILDFDHWQKEGKGLYIFSKTKGSGKTMLSCCIANELMGRLDICVKFISIPELLEMTKDSFKDYEKKADLERIRTAELLIIDDIGVEMKKEWVDSVLFRLIDWRYTQKRTTIFTSNIEIDSLKLDDRITDRIVEMCFTLKLPEKSIRRQQANEKKSAFMKSTISRCSVASTGGGA